MTFRKSDAARCSSLRACVSDRTDAIGFEPLTGGLNAPAMARAKNIDWKRYRYSALIVTGVGPEVDGMALSPFGKYHLRLAANRFADGDVTALIRTGDEVSVDPAAGVVTITSR